jgi:ribonuclease HI
MTQSITALYTDGACSGNPGPGGWGMVAYLSDGSVHELGGGDRATTNNRMEMQAAIAALEFLQSTGSSTAIPLYTDSEYLKNGITQWIKGWKKKGWKTAQGKPVINQDLWQQLDQLNQPFVQWTHVRAHAGNVGNERCDVIARGFSLGQRPQLQQQPEEKLKQAQEKPQQTEEKLKKTEAFSLVDHTRSNSRTIELEMDRSDATFQPEKSSDPPNEPLPIEQLTMDTMNSEFDPSSGLSREVRVTQLRSMVEALRIADEIATKAYLISSSELAGLMDVNASAVTSRGEQWVWRNWVVSRIRREGNQILWQLERIDR